MVRAPTLGDMLIIDAANSVPLTTSVRKSVASPPLWDQLPGCAAHWLQQCHFKPTAPEKNHCAVHIPLDFAAKASIAVGVDGLLLGRAPPGLQRRLVVVQAPRQARCVGENEAMARQTSKQEKSKAEAKVDAGDTSAPLAKREREPQRRTPRVRSRSAARSDRARGAAPKAHLNGSEMVHDKPEQARSRSKLIADRADLTTNGVSGGEPPASTKRAQLIGMLERPGGASVAEIGQRLGWLRHTVRAAITGLRKAGREVTRSKDANDRSVYRLITVKTAGER